MLKHFLRFFFLTILAAAPLSAQSFRGVPLNASLFNSIKADSWNIIGQNIIIKGGIHIPTANGMEIFADQAVINIESQDIEASGGVRFLRWNSGVQTVDAERLMELQRTPDTQVEIQSISGDL